MDDTCTIRPATDARYLLTVRDAGRVSSHAIRVQYGAIQDADANALIIAGAYAGKRISLVRVA